MKVTFNYKGQTITKELTSLEEFDLEEEGVKTVIGRLRGKILTDLKAQGIEAKAAELQFIDICE